MTAHEIVKLAKDTRDAQKAYFKTRSYGDLNNSKAMEAKLDKAIEEYLHPDNQLDLFGKR